MPCALTNCLPACPHRPPACPPACLPAITFYCLPLLQVSKLLTLETPCLDMLADASGANLYRQAAQGFM
jgi:hypothetical protein